MKKIDISYINKCCKTLELAYSELNKLSPDEISYQMYRSACVKEFEIILEQSGKLLKKCLLPYFSNTKKLDKLYFKEIFKYASKHSIISIEEAENWFEYRDNRNMTAHGYGQELADGLIEIIPNFIKDTKSLVSAIEKENAIKR